MKIKRYTARDMRQAMQKVREDQGPDAVILSSRRSDGMVEIVAAIDYDEALVREAVEPLRAERGRDVAELPARAEAKPRAVEIAEAAAHRPRPLTPAELVAIANAEAASAVVAPAPIRVAKFAPGVDVRHESDARRAPIAAQAASIAEVTNATDAPTSAANVAPVETNAKPAGDATHVAASAHEASTAVAAPNSESPRPSVAEARAALGDATDRLRMRDEIGQLRYLLEAQLSSLAWNDLDRRHPLRARVLRDLTRFGIEGDVASDIIEDLPAQLSTEQARYLPLGLLSRRLRVVEEAASLRGVVALVGATGAGKTTTLAKLAARHVQSHGRQSVALIGTDDFRVGAHDQLLHYGRALGVQTFTASDASELSRLLQHVADRDLVLIDTPGLTMRDARLPSVIDTLKANAEVVRTTLVLPANVLPGSLEHSVQAYAPLAPESCILTKLDEAPTPGAALSIVLRHGLAIEFVTDGQRVPEDIHVADARRLVCRLADEAKNESPDERVMAERFGRALLAHS
jgi:flagellar biosynthesis protein FlhF